MPALNDPAPDTDAMPQYWAIVPAAGSGSRMAAEVPKQYLSLAGKTVLEQTLDTLFACDALHGIVLALSPGDRYWPAIAPRYADRNLHRVTGGEERCHSVLNAIRYLGDQAPPATWVLVHDAARPCVRRGDINRLVATLAQDPHGGLLGVPVADTMKRVDPDGRIVGTVDRNGLWHAQTPQMFRMKLLGDALDEAIQQGVMVTDEAAAMELAGYCPRLVAGHTDNIKITVPSDLALAGFFLQAGVDT